MRRLTARRAPRQRQRRSASSVRRFELPGLVLRLLRRRLRSGVATLSTEYRLRGPGPGMPGTLVFSAREIDELIVRPYDWELVQPLGLRLSPATRATEMEIAEAAILQEKEAEVPHIVLAEGELAMTSVHLALRKRRKRLWRRETPAARLHFA